MPIPIKAVLLPSNYRRYKETKLIEWETSQVVLYASKLYDGVQSIVYILDLYGP